MPGSIKFMWELHYLQAKSITLGRIIPWDLEMLMRPLFLCLHCRHLCWVRNASNSPTAIHWADTKPAAGSLERLNNKFLPCGKREFAQVGEECCHRRSNLHPVCFSEAIDVEHDKQNGAWYLTIDSTWHSVINTQLTSTQEKLSTTN